MLNPIVLSIGLGLTFNLMQIQVPTSMDKSLTALSRVTLPCALLCLGAGLVRFKLTQVKTPLTISLVKLLLLPALVFAISCLLGLTAQVTQTLLLLPACPVGINAFILTKKPNGGTTNWISHLVIQLT